MVEGRDCVVIVFWDAGGLGDGCRVRRVGVNDVLARREAGNFSELVD